MQNGTLKSGATTTILPGPGPGHIQPRIPPAAEPILLVAKDPVWKPDQALFIGIGGSGYRILAHVMKNLYDAGKNSLPDGVRFLSINTAEYEQISEEDPLSFAGFNIAKKDIFVLDENLSTPMRNWIEGGTLPEHRGWFNPRGYPMDDKLDLAGGTHGDRQLARVAFLRNIQGKTRFSEWGKTILNSNDDASSIWIQDWLSERCKEVKRDNRIRIVMTGSLAGGMSGIICDLALLARKIGMQVLDEGGGIEIEGFFLDSKPFKGISGSMGDKERDSNCYAALREISHWQINPANYPQSAGWNLDDKDLDRAREPLFNRIYLFSDPPFGSDRDPRLQTSMDVLTKWIIPSVADVITIMLDTTLGSAGTADFFEQGSKKAAERQKKEHQLMVSRAGIYTVRFPAADILKSVHAQLCLQLVLSRLTGEKDGTVQFDHYDADNLGLPADPNVAIDYFLSGELNEVVEGEVSTAERFIKKIFEGDIINLPNFSEEGESIQATTERFQERIASMIVYILLAINESSQKSAKAGHIAYALDFLNCFIERVQIAKQKVLNSGFENGSEFGLVLDSYLSVLKPQVESLQGIKALLVRDENDSEGQKGLVDILTSKTRALDTHIMKMDDIYCRKYLWTNAEISGSERNFRDYLLQKYAPSVIDPDNLSRLNWVMTKGTRGPELDLELVVIPEGKDAPVRLRRDGVDTFVDTFEKWISGITDEAWKEFTLGKIISANELFSSSEDGKRIAEASRPLNRVNSEDDYNAGSSALMEIVPTSLEDRFQKNSDFYNEMMQTYKNQERLEVMINTVPITDPLAAVFLFTQDAICMQNMETYKHLRNEYDRLDGFDMNTGSFDPSIKNRRTVFRADHESREIEMETGRSGQYLYHPYSDWGMLNPLVVSALQFPARAEIYCLAIAEGLVSLTSRKDVSIKDGSGNSCVIESFSSEIDPYVNALIRFSLQDKLPDNCGEIFSSLTRRYDSETCLEGLSTWYEKAPDFWARENADKPEHKSLGNLVVFLARWYLNNRQRRWVND